MTSPMGWVCGYCVNSLGSIFLRKKIDTQKKHHEEEDVPLGRYGGNDSSDNFFLFSPPDFSLVGTDYHTLTTRMES